MATKQENKENITAIKAAKFVYDQEFSWLQLLLIAMSAVLLLTAYVFTGANNWLLIVLASVLFIFGVWADAMSRWINS